MGVYLMCAMQPDIRDCDLLGEGCICRTCRSESLTHVGNSCNMLISCGDSMLTGPCTYLINVLIMESPWSPQSSTQICVEVIRTPKCPLPTFQVDIINARVYPPLPVHAQRQHKMRRRPEQTPTMINPRLPQQPKALHKPRLHAGKPNLSLLRRKLMFSRREEPRTTLSPHVSPPSQQRRKENEKRKQKTHLEYSLPVIPARLVFPACANTINNSANRLLAAALSLIAPFVSYSSRSHPSTVGRCRNRCVAAAKSKYRASSASASGCGGSTKKDPSMPHGSSSGSGRSPNVKMLADSLPAVDMRPDCWRSSLRWMRKRKEAPEAGPT